MWDGGVGGADLLSCIDVEEFPGNLHGPLVVVALALSCRRALVPAVDGATDSAAVTTSVTEMARHVFCR
jgi:hypothetical protein